jgi:hypothetical protein
MDDLRENRPVLAELDPIPLWPMRTFVPPQGNWHKAWRRDRGQGIWPEPRYCTSYRWAKNALALYLHRLALSKANQRQWRHLPYDDRIAAALLGISEAIRRFDRNTYANGLNAYARDWIRKELQRLAKNERRELPERHKPYGFDEFGPGIPMSFRPREYPLVGYDENAYRRQLPYVNVAVDGGTCLVENIRQGAPAGEHDEVEHVGPSFTNWSPVNPETAFAHKEAAYEKFNYRSAKEIVGELRDDAEIQNAARDGRYRDDGSTITTTDGVNAARRDWRHWKKSGDNPHLYRTPTSLKDRVVTASRMNSEPRRSSHYLIIKDLPQCVTPPPRCGSASTLCCSADPVASMKSAA